MMNNNDSKLISDYLAGDEKALEILIKEYLNQIYGFVYKYVRNQPEAEDITQEVFLKVWRNLKRFDQKKSFKAWLFVIAKNTSIDYIRKQKTVALPELLIDKSMSQQSFLDQRHAARLVFSSVKRLSFKYKKIIKLYQKGFNFREISEQLGESLNTIKSRYRRALIKLKEIIGESL